MQKQQFNFGSLFLASFFPLLFYSCANHTQKRYVEQIKNRLTTYDSVTAILIAKYSHYSLGSFTTVYPSHGASYGDGTRVFDSSINDFCDENDISHIELQPTTASKANVTYYLSDNNYQYIYNGYDTSQREVFENTKVRVVPINRRWALQYEKPNF